MPSRTVARGATEGLVLNSLLCLAPLYLLHVKGFPHMHSPHVYMKYVLYECCTVWPLSPYFSKANVFSLLLGVLKARPSMNSCLELYF